LLLAIALLVAACTKPVAGVCCTDAADCNEIANNQIGVNPELLDAINGDFHLRPGSPAVDAADPAAGESIDFDGVSRPQGAGRDIGAHELKP
jgi:hypothetical protein